jgi:hypothetical protein
MKTIEQITNELESSNPALFKSTKDGTVQMSDQERRDMINTWAKTLFENQQKVFASAKRYQVREWMLDNGLNPDNVPALIRSSIPDSLAAEKAINRWLHVEEIPRSHPMVDIVGEILGKTPEQINQAWPAICAL